MQEIVVQGSRFPERLREVGMAIAVVDEQAIERLNLDNLSDVARHLPNVELFEDYPGANVPSWIIRGVGLQDYNNNNTPTAAVYVDEIYQPSVVMSGRALFDVNQVEVLKGPQGGLYGRNTSGGAVLMQSRRATLEDQDGYMKVSLGRWSRLQTEAAAGLGLTEHQALRIALRSDNSNDAWQESLASAEGGRSHWGEQDRWDLRSWYLFQPTENFSLQWKFQTGRDDSEIALARAVGVYSPLGGYCSAALQGYRDDEHCLSFAGLNQALLSRPIDQVSEQARDGSRVWSDPFNRQDSDYNAHSIYLTLDTGFARFQSISARDQFNYGVKLDLDGAAGEYAHRQGRSDIEALSQEFRISSLPQAATRWVAGLVYSDENFTESRDFMIRDNALVSASLGFDFGRVSYEQNTEMLALYGSLSYPLHDALKLNVDLRYTDLEKHYEDGAVYIPEEPPLYILENLHKDYRLNDRVSGALGLEWQLRDNAIVFGRLSQGFKSGGFYGGFLSTEEELVSYVEERVTAWEVGGRVEFPEYSLNAEASLFYYDYSDVQAFVSRVNSMTQTPIDILGNPADARHSGIELGLDWALGENLSFGLDLAYLNAEFVNGREESLDLLGQPYYYQGKRPYAPRFSGSFSIQYSRQLSLPATLNISSDYNYRSALSGHHPTAVDEAVYHLPGFGLLGMEISLDFANGWSLSAWGHNLTDEVYRTRVKNDGVLGFAEIFGTPRSGGVSVHYSW